MPLSHPSPRAFASPRSLSARLWARVAGALDRTDPDVKVAQDLAASVTLFALAVVLINKYGHKLAV